MKRHRRVARSSQLSSAFTGFRFPPEVILFWGCAASMSNGVKRCTHRCRVTWSTSMPLSTDTARSSTSLSRSALVSAVRVFVSRPG